MPTMVARDGPWRRRGSAAGRGRGVGFCGFGRVECADSPRAWAARGMAVGGHGPTAPHKAEAHRKFI